MRTEFASSEIDNIRVTFDDDLFERDCNENIEERTADNRVNLNQFKPKTDNYDFKRIINPLKIK